MIIGDDTTTRISTTPAAAVSKVSASAAAADVTGISNIPDYRSLLRSCALGHVPPSAGYRLHAASIKSGLLPLLATPIFHMYAAFLRRRPSSDRLLLLRAFCELPPSARSAPDWTALISALPASARSIRLFRSMLRASVRPDAVALLTLLSAAASLASPATGASAHLLFFKLGLPFFPRARNATLHMYASCGRMPEARSIFREMEKPATVVAWTALLSGVLRWEGLESGRQVFDQMPQRNEVSWTIMVAACVEAGFPREGLSLLARMLFSGDNGSSMRILNQISVCSLLSACSQAGDLTIGRWIHAHFIKASKSLNHNDKEEEEEHHLLMVGTALVDMYGKCGRLEVARRAFEIMPRRNVVAWNAMLTAVSMHGMGEEALRLFDRMVAEEAQRPDGITFVSILSACSRSGLVEQGRKLFHDLSGTYKLVPELEHYACMIDLLGRAGHLDEAESLVREMPFRPNEVVLGSLLASCALHRKLELGRSLMEELVQMDSYNTEYHVLLSNMYTSSGRHSEADELRLALQKNGMRKVPGISYIEIDDHIHRFTAGDKSHPRTSEVYAMLDEVVRRLELAGYIPDAACQAWRSPDNFLLNDDEREERERGLLVHSERLAISLGLISTTPGVPLRIFKNLRMCSDCHAATKLISLIFEREIIIRDRNRFHCFKEVWRNLSDDPEKDLEASLSAEYMNRLILLTSNARSWLYSEDEMVDLMEPRFESFLQANAHSL